MIAPDFAVTTQPGRHEIEQLAQFGFRTIINNRPDGEELGQLPPDEERAEAEQQGLSYVHVPVTVSSISAADIEAFGQAVQESPSR